MQSRAVPFAGEWSWMRLVPSWPVLVFMLALYPALTQPLNLLNDPDTYLHIAAGRWMIEHLALPFRDPFSHSMPGAAWGPHEWLAQAALAGAFALAGWSGVITLTLACFALALASLTRFLLARFEPVPALIGTAAAAALLLPHLLARPHILALPCLVLWSGVLFVSRDAGRSPPLSVLPILTLWANLHGSFLAGIVLAAALAGEAVIWPAPGKPRREEALRWGGFVLLSAAAGLLTPLHVEGFLQPFRLMGMPSLQAHFLEWQSPALAAAPALEFWVLGALFAGWAGGLKLPLPRVAIVLGLLYASFQHNRHADLLALIAPLAVAAALGPQIRERLQSGSRSPPDAGGGHVRSLAGIALALAALVFIAARPIARGDDAVTPSAALATATAAGVSGPVLNNEGFGGFLMFRGIPVFIDGRIEMYGDTFLARDLKAVQGDRESLSRILNGYRIGWTLLRPQDPAVALLDRSEGWHRVYSDSYAVIHARN